MPVPEQVQLVVHTLFTHVAEPEQAPPQNTVLPQLSFTDPQLSPVGQLRSGLD